MILALGLVLPSASLVGTVLVLTSLLLIDLFLFDQYQQTTYTTYVYPLPFPPCYGQSSMSLRSYVM